MKTLRELITHIQHIAMLAVVTLSLPVQAQIEGTIPEAPTPSSGDSDNWLELFFGWMADGVNAAAFVLAALVFIYVIRNVIVAYGRTQEGNGTVGEVFIQGIVGTVIIAMVVLFATQATEVFS